MDVVVFTGTLTKWTRKEATATAEASGYKVGAGLTAATTILVYGDKAGKKLEDAKKKGVQVYSEDEWEAKLNASGGDQDEDMEDTEGGDGDDDAMEEDDEQVEKNNDVVVFTGTLTTQTRKEAVADAEAHGYTVGASVTKATTILVCGEKAGKKAEDAQKKGIKIFTEDEWANHLSGDSSAATSKPKPAPAPVAVAKADKAGAKRKAQPEDDTTQQVVVFTGTLVKHSRKEATQLAEAKGFRVEPRVTRSTTILVCGERAGQKKDDAEKQGIQIYTEDEWQAKIDELDDVTDGSASPPPSKKAATSKSVEPRAVSDGEVDYDSETGAINGIAPKTLITDGTLFDVKSSSSNSTYTVKRLGSTYTCSCPAWRNQRHAPTSRTCKHLKEILGEAFEAARASGSAAAPRSTKPATNSPTKSRKAAVVKSSAPNVLLAKKWEREKNDPVNWWISEKLDGVRAYWDAKKRVFLSRLGNEYPAPDWFIEGFPSDHDLDGELFGGRARFQFTVGIAKTENSTHWDQLVYKVFDVPSQKEKPFEDRMEYAQTLVKDTGSKYIEWVEHTKCKSLAHLDQVFDEIEKLGGEGLMIREPGSKYVGGRSSSLLKIKRFHDGEAEVIAHEDGKGKYTGMCGALRCKMASGKMFKVASGLSDEQREHPPKVGSIIVYKCQELTNDGIPRFPVFLGVAADKDKPTDPVIANAVGRDE